MTPLQDSLFSGNRRLRLAFEQTGDRVAHRLFAGEQLLLESVEGSATEAWPAGPPLQSLLIEPRPNDAAVALLVGMAGRSHWSASVEPQPNGFLFDIACRVSEPPQALGSGYRIVSGHATEQGGLLCVEFASGVKLTMRPIAPAALALDGEMLRVLAPPASSAAKQTVRWRYELSLD